MIKGINRDQLSEIGDQDITLPLMPTPYKLLFSEYSCSFVVHIN